MSKLPEQKKSPEEIASLRDQLGIRPAAPAADAPPVANPLAPQPSAAEPVVLPAPTRQDAARSLHDVPEVSPAPLDEETGLPVKRRTADELAALRLRGVFETQDGAMHLPVRRERTLWVICGYLFAAAAAIPVYHGMPALLPLAMSLVALAYAAFLFFRRPYSSHHGAFIGIVVMFVLIYAALQYFPHLRHAT